MLCLITLSKLSKFHSRWWDLIQAIFLKLFSTLYSISFKSNLIIPCTNICRTAKYQTGNGQTRPARRTHSEDIKERTKLLEKAMFKDNCTQDLGNKINKNDPNYGKPQQGTLTEFRGQKAHTHVHKVIVKLNSLQNLSF